MRSGRIKYARGPAFLKRLINAVNQRFAQQDQIQPQFERRGGQSALRPRHGQTP
jgi:hypothetical protein